MKFIAVSVVLTVVIFVTSLSVAFEYMIEDVSYEVPLEGLPPSQQVSASYA